ncbi:MAG: 3-isopropylmalate dehydratase large subunit [Actinobacteria bacterium]|jgi:3-isopropylmalate/(R)-2-methylmalate dehydratase large subunit|nr:MAG: 3-isopropylmalate dehydratase large subunit [Actinomycetota bacterium]
MGCTITEKILAWHCGRDEVQPGELVNARVDLVLANDITAPLAIEAFRAMGAKQVFDPARVVLVPDHFAPARDILAAENCAMIRDFARELGLEHYYEVGRVGIEHVLLPEEGLVLPGELIVGADSHTCTYGALGAFSTGMGSTDAAMAMALGEVWLRVPESMRLVYGGELAPWVGGKDLILHTIGRIGVDGARYRSMEFCGPAIEALSMQGRFTMANMAVEAGAKNGIFAVDGKTRSWLEKRARRDYRVFESDADASYAEELSFDVSALEPQVAFPHLPSNVRPISQAGEVKIDQVVIGSCTNGWLEDMETAARILEGREVHPHVRVIVFPGTPKIKLEMIRRGWMETFIQAGAVVSTPTCGPCLGGHMGVIAAGERAVSTTNRNFVGRMGHKEGEVYLTGPAVAAASAVTGRLSDPREVMG